MEWWEQPASPRAEEPERFGIARISQGITRRAGVQTAKFNARTMPGSIHRSAVLAGREKSPRCCALGRVAGFHRDPERQLVWGLSIYLSVRAVREQSASKAQSLFSRYEEARSISRRVMHIRRLGSAWPANPATTPWWCITPPRWQGRERRGEERERLRGAWGRDRLARGWRRRTTFCGASCAS